MIGWPASRHHPSAKAMGGMTPERDELCRWVIAPLRGGPGPERFRAMLGTRLQSRAHRLLHRTKPDKLDGAAHLLWDIIEIPTVACRLHHARNPRARCGHDLLLDPTHR